MSKRQHKPKRYLYEDYEHLPPQGMREGGRSLRGIDPSSTETSQLSSNMPVMSCEQIGILMQTCEGGIHIVKAHRFATTRRDRMSVISHALRIVVVLSSSIAFAMAKSI